MAFLSEVHVGVVCIPLEGRGPLAVPVWYSYQPGGELMFVTGKDSFKARLLHIGKRISLCAQNETPPYIYVSVEGPVTDIREAELERDRRPLAHRYLGNTLGDRYIRRTGDLQEIRVTVRIGRWYGACYEQEEGEEQIEKQAG